MDELRFGKIIPDYLMERKFRKPQESALSLMLYNIHTKEGDDIPTRRHWKNEPRYRRLNSEKTQAIPIPRRVKKNKSTRELIVGGRPIQ